MLAILRSRLLQSAMLAMKHCFAPAHLDENALLILAGGYGERGNFFEPLIINARPRGNERSPRGLACVNSEESIQHDQIVQDKHRFLEIHIF